MTDNTQNSFGDNLRGLIISAGLKYSEAAEELDISVSYLQQLMRGERNPSFETIKGVCARFQVTEADLFSSDLSRTRLNPQRPMNQTTFEEFKKILPLMGKIPKDILEMLAEQDAQYFQSIRRELQTLQQKRSKKSSIASND